MNIWIIYTKSFGYAKLISEIFETYLENDFNVSVANAEIIEPALIIDEIPDFLVFGELFKESSPNVEIQTWINKFLQISKLSNF